MTCKTDSADLILRARSIVTKLNGKWYTNYGFCLCPAHEDKKPSLRVTAGDTQILLRCFAGCETRDILKCLANDLQSDNQLHEDKHITPQTIDVSGKRARAASWLWSQRVSLMNTVGEQYLKGRGIEDPNMADVQFLKSCKNLENDTSYPTLCAAIRDSDNVFQAVHRIYLSHATKTKITEANSKTILGPMTGNSVHLGDAESVLGICEGLETGLSARHLFQLPIWAGLTAYHMAQINIPACVRHVVIFGDNDEPGRTACMKAMNRFEKMGKQVTIKLPPKENTDWNDQLLLESSQNHAFVQGQ